MGVLVVLSSLAFSYLEVCTNLSVNGLSSRNRTHNIPPEKIGGGSQRLNHPCSWRLESSAWILSRLSGLSSVADTFISMCALRSRGGIYVGWPS